MFPGHSPLPEVGPANEVHDTDEGDEDGGNVDEELGGRVAVLVGGICRDFQEEENQGCDTENNGPERNAGNVGGQGCHETNVSSKILRSGS